MFDMPCLIYDIAGVYANCLCKISMVCVRGTAGICQVAVIRISWCVFVCYIAGTVRVWMG